MKYCLSSNLNKEYLKKADEIRCKNLDEILDLYYSTKYDYINNRTYKEDLKNKEICINYKNVAMEINRRLFN